MQDKIKIDLKTGLRIETVPYNAKGKDIIETPCTESFYLPRWNGEAWEESLNLAEIEVIKAQATPPEPTLEDRVTATENGVVTLKETIDAIFGGI